MLGRVAPEVWRASADAIIATVAGGLVLVIFYPITLCAAGAKNLVRMIRPNLLSHPERQRVTHSR
jgi:hypothetical protein